MNNVELSSPLACPGKYYVNCHCLDHDVCGQTAPTIFGRDEENAVWYVKKQPSTIEEVSSTQEALEACPMEAIKSNGHEVNWEK